MTLIPYPNDPARLAATNPIFNDNSFVRGDEQRLNNSEIWANFTNLDGLNPRVDIIEASYQYRGYINGGLGYNTASTFPAVKAGVYEVNGKLIYKTSDTNIALTDTFFDNLQAIDSYCAYMIMMNPSGTIKYLLYGEGIAQASQSVTNITGTTTKTLTVPTVPGSGTEQYIALISGTGSFTGAFKATRASATTFTIVLNSDLGSTFTGMTVVLYNKIRTLHGTGSLTDITANLSINYSPSLGENTESNAFALFDTNRNGFYCTLSGLSDYRVIGTMTGSSSSSNVLPSQIISFKTGRNKNDNRFYVDSVSALVTNAMRWTSLNYVLGCDYIFYTNNATYGSWVLINRAGIVSHRLQVYNSGAAVTRALYASPGAGGFIQNALSASADTQKTETVGGSAAVTGVSDTLYVNKDFVIKPLSGAVTTSDDRNRYDFVLDLD